MQVLKDEIRQNILLSAKRLFHEKGYNNASIRPVFTPEVISNCEIYCLPSRRRSKKTFEPPKRTYALSSPIHSTSQFRASATNLRETIVLLSFIYGSVFIAIIFPLILTVMNICLEIANVLLVIDMITENTSKNTIMFFMGFYYSC